jgi:hypothetical protein
MGYRNDDFIDDERADAKLRQALERLQALDQLPPPADLVTRTARRLPAAPPALAARQIARRAVWRATAIAGAVALLVLLGAIGVFGGGERLARLFGDGGSGVSRVLLTIQLLAKPLWHSVGSGGAVLLATGVVALAAAAWLWWWALRRTPIYYMENAP